MDQLPLCDGGVMLVDVDMCFRLQGKRLWRDLQSDETPAGLAADLGSLTSIKKRTDQ